MVSDVGEDSGDLARALDKFDESSVVALIRKRYDANSIYTNINAMMLAVNPYKDLGLCACLLAKCLLAQCSVDCPRS